LKFCEAFDKRAYFPGATSPHTVTPAEEVFIKTLSLFCALINKGCAFDALEDGIDISDDLSVGSHHDPDAEDSSDSSSDTTSDRRRQRPKARQCNGKLLMMSDDYRRPLIQLVQNRFHCAEYFEANDRMYQMPIQDKVRHSASHSQKS